MDSRGHSVMVEAAAAKGSCNLSGGPSGGHSLTASAHCSSWVSWSALWLLDMAGLQRTGLDPLEKI
jgi:hypothetical protein